MTFLGVGSSRRRLSPRLAAGEPRTYSPAGRSPSCGALADARIAATGSTISRFGSWGFCRESGLLASCIRKSLSYCFLPLLSFAGVVDRGGGVNGSADGSSCGTPPLVPSMITVFPLLSGTVVTITALVSLIGAGLSASSGSCSGSCSGACTGSCSGACTGSCSGACTAASTGGCTGDCTGGCTGGCSGACTGGCSGACTGGCSDSVVVGVQTSPEVGSSGWGETVSGLAIGGETSSKITAWTEMEATGGRRGW